MNREIENREQLIARVKEKSKDGRISCTAARQVAEEMKVPLRAMGPLCDEIDIKIVGCELGCF